jgi:anaerobic C4-dicarboxylate transporter
MNLITELLLGLWLFGYIGFCVLTVYFAIIKTDKVSPTKVGKYLVWHGYMVMIVLASSVPIGIALMLAKSLGHLFIVSSKSP